jgi:signal transduction histidine kinase
MFRTVARDDVALEVAYYLYLFPYFIPISFTVFIYNNYLSGKVFNGSYLYEKFVYFSAYSIVGFLLTFNIIFEIHGEYSSRIITYNFFPNILYSFLLVTNFVIALYSIKLWGRVTTEYKEQQQSKLIFRGSLLSTIIPAITNVFLPSLGIHKFNWLGPVSVLFLTSFTFYAVLRYKFFDIKTLGAKLIKYFFYSLFAYVTFYVLIYLYLDWFGTVFTRSSYLLGVVFAPLFIFLLLRLELIVNTVNKFIFGNLFIHNDLLTSLAKFMSEHLGRDEVKDEVLNNLRIFLDTDVDVVGIDFKVGQDDLVHKVGQGERLWVKSRYDGPDFSKEDKKLVEQTALQLSFAFERAVLYEKVAHNAEMLKLEVEEKTKELKIKNSTLTELIRSKDEFLHIVNHQLNTPLAVMKSAAGMAKDKLWSMDKFYEVIERQVGVLELILKDFWRAQDKQITNHTIHKIPVDIDLLITNIVEDKKLQAKVRSGVVRLNMEIAKDMHTVVCDPAEIAQVVSNFIDNALYYTREGSVSIGAEISNSMFIFKVTDTGIGITKEYMPKMFTRFSRSESAEKARPDGSGLGLYICKGIIEAHGGSVSAASDGEGLGSTFTFSIPVA